MQQETIPIAKYMCQLSIYFQQTHLNTIVRHISKLILNILH